MLYIPFIYFLSFFLYFYRKNKGIDVVSFIFLLYTITSFCSILVVQMGLFGESGVLFNNKSQLHLGFIPTFLYLFLITICVVPFKNLKLKSSISKLPPNWTTKLLLYIFIGVAIVNFYVYSTGVSDIMSSDLNAVRNAHYAGEENVAQLRIQELPFILKYVTYLNKLGMVAVLYMFYSLCFLNKSKLYNLTLFACSLIMPISSIQTADRTGIIMYLLMVCFCLVFFKNFIRKKEVSFLRKIFIPLITILAFYILIVTIARFDDRVIGSQGSIIIYAGQSYLNFCYIFDNANFDVHFWDRVFPITNHIVLGLDYDVTREFRYMTNGFISGIFSSFAGTLLLDVGPFFCTIWCFLFSCLCVLIFRSFSRNSNMLGEIIIGYVLAIVPVFGIFYYYYYSFYTALLFLISVCFYFVFKRL